MGYLEKFARNRKGKEKSEVLTARLPESLYHQFKDYCDELGLSMSEAVFLLVEREMTGLKPEQPQEKESILQPKVTTVMNTNDDKKNDVVVVTNTNVVKPKRIASTQTGKRFTTKPWNVDGELPCPRCSHWISAANFSRHAKQHNTSTEAIFTNQTFIDKANEMVKERTGSKV